MDRFPARTLGDTVVRSLRDAIYGGDLPGGTRLIDSELAEHMDVSRSTAREALRVLKNEGLVISHPHRGYFVVELEPNQVLELLEMRSLLEGRAAAAAVRSLRRADFDRLESITEQFEQIDYVADIQTVRELDIQFHQIVTCRCDRPILLELWSSLNSRLYMLESVCVDTLMVSSADCAQRHREYIAALRTGDPADAHAAGEGHYQYLFRRYHEWLRTHRSLRRVDTGAR